MKKRALLLVFLLATIGIMAHRTGRQMVINQGGKVVATYELPQVVDSITFETYNIYAVTAVPFNDSFGRVTTSSDEVKQGNTVALSATPNEGYQFVNWTVNGEVVSTTNPYTAIITSDTEYVANFEESQVIEGFRLKNVNNGYYLSFTNYDSYSTNSRNNAGMGVVAFSGSSDDQIFKFEPAENGKYYIVSNSGYYIYCAYWQCHAHKTLKTKFTVEKNGDYYTIYQTEANGEGSNFPGYVAPQTKDSGSKVYCDNSSSNGYKTWIFEPIGTLKEYSVSVKTSDETKGTVEASETSVYSGSPVILRAIPSIGYKFSSWTVNGAVVSTENPYTATVTANTEYVANFVENAPGTENGHEYVDLGLPSGLKWATCNVGATTPEEYGDCFAWGETEPKDYYDWSTYKYCNGSNTTMTKYCTSSSYGTVDNKTTLELTDDAAHVNWGGNWRMPTRAEQDELRNTSNCTWEWTTQNGVNGYKVTSVVNGNSIFLPAAGYRYNDNLYYAGSYGYYWSSSLYASYSYNACDVYFNSSYVNVYNYFYRYYGLSVRAVCE